MKKLKRRTFLLIAGGGGAAVAAGVAVPVVSLLAKSKDNVLTFRAVGGLPVEGKLPSYCSYVLDGHVDLTAQSGMVTRSMHVGYPQGTLVNDVTWPGFTQSIRVTSAQQSGDTITIKGIVDDRSQLLYGESANVTIQVQNANKSVDAPFASDQVALNLAQ